MCNMDFFKVHFWADVMKLPQWGAMRSTVENSPWHREANTSVHTAMTIHEYTRKINTGAWKRTEREQLITLLALLFHDFGKPEAEEVVQKTDGSGDVYRRYAGHEAVSANEFMNVMCDNPDLVKSLFGRGFTWDDIRIVKFMIENHLPYGMTNAQKRSDLATAISCTLKDDVQCFFDMLRCDAAGRISDDHPEKLQNVENWINEFILVPVKQLQEPHVAPTMMVLVGPSGAGKSTFTKKFLEENPEFELVSEDEYRLEYAELNMNHVDLSERISMSESQWYDAAWHFCHMVDEKGYNAFVKKKYDGVLARRANFILDRTNRSKKQRLKWSREPIQKGYRVITVEFFISENMLNARQKTRGDKFLSAKQVHEQAFSMSVPWVGVEAHEFQIIHPGEVQ